jgi:hypothetical protein
MKPERAAKIKYGTWGFVCGAVIAMIIGFGWGGWTTAGTTQSSSVSRWRWPIRFQLGVLLARPEQPVAQVVVLGSCAPPLTVGPGWTPASSGR